MKYLILVSAFALLIVFSAVATAAPALDQPANDQEPAYKQDFEAAEQADQAVLDQGLHAPKHPELRPAASCPNIKFATGIFPFRFGPFFGGRHIVNYVAGSIQSSHYIVYAGAPDDAPDQGLMRVLIEPADPCSARQVGASLHDYLTATGPLTIQGVSANVVTFVSPGGADGHFDLVAGRFLP